MMEDLIVKVIFYPHGDPKDLQDVEFTFRGEDLKEKFGSDWKCQAEELPPGNLCDLFGKGFEDRMEEKAEDPVFLDSEIRWSDEPIGEIPNTGPPGFYWIKTDPNPKEDEDDKEYSSSDIDWGEEEEERYTVADRISEVFSPDTRDEDWIRIQTRYNL